MIDDKKLYKDFLNGSIEAFETLVIEYKDNLIYFISRYTGGDLSTAEDIAQDVFAYVYVYKEKYDFNYSFKTYIFTLGKNKAIDFMRKHSRLSFNSYDEELEKSSDYKTIEDKIVDDEEKKLVFDSYKKLKPEYQRALYLYVFEELSYKEISRVMGKSLPQIKILIHRARNFMRTFNGRGGQEYEE
ncbi:sigma-70 family RNA polymerase sigma factor [Tissierella sp. Yu-01]|uniref:RNA polymerase sigma factor n=1 Tax=Tissierella sp. Yu-01 TaxID=3035694 RepID=UPI00240DE745|nr:sigma-70 family RNA polymerase sigma factor [Tissierella sp. Yu-01]WFA07778.1 sigma-70 family RNA polymerase sigma factor [Tissierella sp. Yu-01]